MLAPDQQPEAEAHQFTTTHWSVVLRAREMESVEAAVALERLCRAYWYPLYVYVRRKGYAPDDAQDLTQGFFAKLLAGNFLNRADRTKGRFRSFLLGALEHFLAREWTKARAQKRGGGQEVISLNEMDAEARYLHEPAHNLTPEKIFDRRWATTLLEQAIAALRREYLANNQEEIFDRLAGSLPGDGPSGAYAETAAGLGMSEGAVRVAAHRLRQRYGEMIRAEIAQTVAAPEEVDEELRHLFAALRD